MSVYYFDNINGDFELDTDLLTIELNNNEELTSFITISNVNVYQADDDKNENKNKEKIFIEKPWGIFLMIFIGILMLTISVYEPKFSK